MKFYGYRDSFFADSHQPNLEVYDLVRETQCGYWIKLSYHGSTEVWVSKTARKRTAYPDRVQALQSYILRKERQVHLLTTNLAATKKRLATAKAIDPNKLPEELEAHTHLIIEDEFL